MGSNPLQRAKIKFILFEWTCFFMFFAEEDSKRTVCRKANCNLSGNGCKVRGRVGGVAVERIFSAPKSSSFFSSGLDFFMFFAEEDSKRTVCRKVNLLTLY